MDFFRKSLFFLLFLCTGVFHSVGAMSYNEAFENQAKNDGPIKILPLYKDMDRYNQYLEKDSQGNIPKHRLEEVEKEWQPLWNAIFKTMRSYEIKFRKIRAVEKLVFASYAMRHLAGKNSRIIDFCAVFTYCARSNYISKNLLSAIENHNCVHQQGSFEHEAVFYQIPYISILLETLKNDIGNIENTNDNLEKKLLSILKEFILGLFFEGESRNESVLEQLDNITEDDSELLIQRLQEIERCNVNSKVIKAAINDHLFKKSHWTDILTKSVDNNYSELVDYAMEGNFKSRFDSQAIITIADLKECNKLFQFIKEFRNQCAEASAKENVEASAKETKSSYFNWRFVSIGALLAAIIGGAWYYKYRASKK